MSQPQPLKHTDGVVAVAEVEVIQAYLQSPTTVPGLFGTATNLETKTQKTMKMVVEGQFLKITNSRTTAMIPLTNVKVIILK